MRNNRCYLSCPVAGVLIPPLLCNLRSRFVKIEAMQRSASLLCVFVGIAGLLCAAPAVAQSPRPEDTLAARHGLQRLPASNIWVLPVETELRSYWHDLPQHRDAIGAIEQALHERIERNAREWNQAERSEKTLRATLSGLARNDRQRPQIEQQLTTLRLGISPPDQLADVEDVRSQLQELIARRHAIWLAAQAIRQKTAQLQDSYLPLQSDEQVSAIVRKAGVNHRLGPAKNYRDDLKKLPEFERLALTSWVPLTIVGQRQRVCLLANETTPITFTWTSSPEPTLITAAMAEAIGIQPRPGADEQMVGIAKQTWKAKPATLPYLRFGKYELRDIDVLILPPDAESIGARIGPAAFEGYHVQPQPHRLRMDINPLNETSP